MPAALAADRTIGLVSHTSYTGTCISGGKTQTRPAVVPCDRTFGWPCLMQYFPKGCGGRSPVTMWKEFRRQSTQLEVMRGYKHILTHSDHMKSGDVETWPAIRHRAVPGRDRTSDQRTAEQCILAIAVCIAAGFVERREIPAGRTPGDRCWCARTCLAHGCGGRSGTRRVGSSRSRTGQRCHPDADSPAGSPTNKSARCSRKLTCSSCPVCGPNRSARLVSLAAQHGVPAAAYDVGGIRAWSTDGEGGHLAPAAPPTTHGLADAVLRCLADPQHHAELLSGGPGERVPLHDGESSSRVDGVAGARRPPMTSSPRSGRSA